MSCTARDVFIAVFFCLLSSTNLAGASENSLDLDSNFFLSWKAEDGAIYFKARVKTAGYVGVGVSLNGTISDTDICIGGVKDNETYFWDYYGLPGGKLERDECLMCNLTSVTEINGTTTLKFMRYFITEENDFGVNITDSKLYLMCVYGDSDEVSVSNMTVGSKLINLLNYEHPPTTTPSGCNGIYSLPVSCLRLFVFSFFATFGTFV